MNCIHTYNLSYIPPRRSTSSTSLALIAILLPSISNYLPSPIHQSNIAGEAGCSNQYRQLAVCSHAGGSAFIAHWAMKALSCWLCIQHSKSHTNTDTSLWHPPLSLSLSYQQAASSIPLGLCLVGVFHPFPYVLVSVLLVS